MTMNDQEKMEAIKSYRDITHISEQFAERRSSEVADDFTRLEVQIATILIGFAGLFLNSFNEKIVGLSESMETLMKYMYAISMFSLILSLIMGLIHIKRKEKFWDEMVHVRFARFKKWMQALVHDTTFEEAKAFQDGTNAGKLDVLNTPLWTWVLQTTFLGVAFVLFFIIFLIFLF